MLLNGCIKSAINGYIDAYFYLGEWFSCGDGLAIDMEKSIYWYKKSADEGNEEAKLKLGMIYYHGDGVDINLREAFKWLYDSAQSYNSEGLNYTLASCMEKEKERY